MFAAELDALGIWFPEGDGDALRISADSWSAAADLLEDIGLVLAAAAGSVVDNYHGDAATRFAELWSHWSGPEGYLATTVADCRRIAAALADFATDIDVADRALLHLIEQALDAQLVPTLALLDELWRDWLADGALTIGTVLAQRADASTAPLATVGLQPVLSPEERAAIDPTRVTWPDLSEPDDLTFLATTPVDLGAGEGDLPTVDGPSVPTEPGDGTTAPDDPATSTPGSLPGSPSGGGINIVVNGDGNTITIETPSYGAPDLGSTGAFADTPLPDPLAPDPISSFDAFAGDAEGYDAGSYADTTFDPSAFDTAVPSVASAPARLAELDTVEAETFTPATPIIIDPPDAEVWPLRPQAWPQGRLPPRPPPADRAVRRSSRSCRWAGRWVAATSLPSPSAASSRSEGTADRRSISGREDAHHIGVGHRREVPVVLADRTEAPRRLGRDEQVGDTGQLDLTPERCHRHGEHHRRRATGACHLARRTRWRRWRDHRRRPPRCDHRAGAGRRRRAARRRDHRVRCVPPRRRRRTVPASPGVRS